MEARECMECGKPEGDPTHETPMGAEGGCPFVPFTHPDDDPPAPKCPVTILGARCGATIAAGEGELVMHGGKGWLVCANCARRGVRQADVANATPVLDL